MTRIYVFIYFQPDIINVNTLFRSAFQTLMLFFLQIFGIKISRIGRENAEGENRKRKKEGKRDWA